MPTLEDARLYLGIDYPDDVTDSNIKRALRSAESVLYGAVGEDVVTYLPADPRIDELILIYMEDLYSQRGVSQKVSGATRRLVYDMEQQLRLELSWAKEVAGS